MENNFYSTLLKLYDEISIYLMLLLIGDHRILSMVVGPIGYRPTFCFFLLLLLQSLSSSSSFPHFYLPQTPQPIHFPKAYDNSYSKTNREHKYKDKDEYKDNDKDKDTERITESLTVCYIFGIPMTQAFQV